MLRSLTQNTLDFQISVRLANTPAICSAVRAQWTHIARQRQPSFW